MIRARRESPLAAPSPGAVETIVGKSTEFKGDLKSSGTIRVDGRLEGTLHTTGDVIVGEGGVLVADVYAASILVAGEIQGQVKATARLEVAASGKIQGDVETPLLVVNEGGRIDGKCTMTAGERVPLAAGSPPSGSPPKLHTDPTDPS